MDLGEVWKDSQSGVGDGPVMCRLTTKCYYIHAGTSGQQTLCAVSHGDKIRQRGIHRVNRDNKLTSEEIPRQFREKLRWRRDKSDIQRAPCSKQLCKHI